MSLYTAKFINNNGPIIGRLLLSINDRLPSLLDSNK